MLPLDCGEPTRTIQDVELHDSLLQLPDAAPGSAQLIEAEILPGTARIMDRLVVVRSLVGDAWQTSVHGVASEGTAAITLTAAKRTCCGLGARSMGSLLPLRQCRLR